MTRWGLVSTIKAPARDVLRFAAYHLEAGAHRIYIYLDAENPVAFNALKAHSKCRVVTCDAPYWAKHGNRPKKHQVRQSVNATHAYNRRAEVDWLIHMDVDEFLVSDQGVAQSLAALATDTKVARVRPMEALSGNTSDPTAFKAFIPNGPGRAAIVRDLYPTFSQYLKGGFLSHLAGKVFMRSGLDNVRLQIHNGFQHDKALPDTGDQQDIALAHCHATSWEDWYAAFRYRHDHGSYRVELAPNQAREKGGINLHELFAMIEADSGAAGLREFFDEVCADTPTLRERLNAHDLLRLANLNLDRALATHFPNVTL